MNLSVIIATHNSARFIENCLEGVYCEKENAPEIIIVDNASTDETINLVQASFPSVRVIGNRTNLGHCRAVNQGFAQSTRDYLMVLDADTVVQPDALHRLLDFLQTRPDIAIVAPKVLNADGSLQRTARNFPRPLNGLFGRQSLLTRWFPSNPVSKRYLGKEDNELGNMPFDVEFVSSACMMFSRQLIQRIGPWDEQFSGYWADADWCKRVRVHGSVYCAPQAVIIHVEQNRRGVKKGASRVHAFHRGAYIFYRKHFTFGHLDPRAIAAAVLLCLRAGLLILVDGCLKPASYSNASDFRNRTTLSFAEKHK